MPSEFNFNSEQHGELEPVRKSALIGSAVIIMLAGAYTEARLAGDMANHGVHLGNTVGSLLFTGVFAVGVKLGLTIS